MKNLIKLIIGLGFIVLMIFQSCEPMTKDTNSAKNYVVPDSLVMDLIAEEGVELVIKNCTACHSAKLIAQNRSTRDGWKSMISWMQSTQNLWDLGEDEEIVLNYLAKNYAPDKMGRRKNLDNIEWYPLED